MAYFTCAIEDTAATTNVAKNNTFFIVSFSNLNYSGRKVTKKAWKE